MKDKASAIAALTAPIDQADAAIKRFLATTSDEEIELAATGGHGNGHAGPARQDDPSPAHRD